MVSDTGVAGVELAGGVGCWTPLGMWLSDGASRLAQEPEGQGWADTCVGIWRCLISSAAVLDVDRVWWLRWGSLPSQVSSPLQGGNPS